MTKPDELYNNVLQTMQYLDTRLPNGSHVMLSGLLNGSYYYKYLAERFHPIGRLRKDVKFKDVYSFLSCLQVNPCNGWLTTNATQRNLTVQYAHELSLIIKNISQSFKFKNFDMAYMDFPFDKVISRWEASKGEAWQLFEPADGLHITQFAHATLADVLWDQVNEIKPDWLGHVNPNNPLITKIFGDQGGY
jgi:acyloxyacyl hydrolase